MKIYRLSGINMATGLNEVANVAGNSAESAKKLMGITHRHVSLCGVVG